MAKILFLFLLIAIVLFGSATVVQATGERFVCRGGILQPEEGIVICNPLQARSFEELLESITTWLFNIAVILAPVMLIFAGFLFVTAAGDPNQIQRAKNLIVWTIAGFAIISVARMLAYALKTIIGG